MTTSRRSFLAAGLAVPMIVTLEPKHASELQSPPPEPARERGETVVERGGITEPVGVLAFTGQPLDKQTAAGLAAIGAGLLAIWVKRKDGAVLIRYGPEQ